MEFNSGGGETLCHSEMELDLREKDQERAEALAEVLVGAAWAEHGQGLGPAAIASVRRAERLWRMNEVSHAMTWYVPNAAPIW